MPTGERNPYTPNVMKTEFLWTQNGMPAANVLYAGTSTSSTTSADLAYFANGLAAAFWTDTLQGFYSTFTNLVGVRCTDMSSDTGAMAEFPMNVTGTISDEGVGAQMCVMVNYAIARRYRGGHPRTYYPGMAASYLDTPQSWSETGIDAVASSVDGLYTAMGSLSSGPTTLTGQVCVSYADDKAWRVDNLVEPIVNYVMNNSVKTQRRRLTSSSY